MVCYGNLVRASKRASPLLSMRSPGVISVVAQHFAILMLRSRVGGVSKHAQC